MKSACPCGSGSGVAGGWVVLLPLGVALLPAAVIPGPLAVAARAARTAAAFCADAAAAFTSCARRWVMVMGVSLASLTALRTQLGCVAPGVSVRSSGIRM